MYTIIVGAINWGIFKKRSKNKEGRKDINSKKKKNKQGLIGDQSINQKRWIDTRYITYCKGGKINDYVKRRRRYKRERERKRKKGRRRETGKQKEMSVE